VNILKGQQFVELVTAISIQRLVFRVCFLRVHLQYPGTIRIFASKKEGKA